MKKKNKFILQIFASSILLFSISQFMIKIIDTYHIKQMEQQINQQKKKETTKKLQQFQKQNNDMIGWITISDTKINYPVVQSENNEYYLNHDFKKRKNQAGWIFMDYRNQKKFSNTNTILYGHGRIDGTMFGTLKNLLTVEWWQKENHKFITTFSNESKITWQIFSGYTIPAESYYLSTYFSSKKSYQKFLATIKKRSIYSFDTNITTNDQILTLSTCKNDHNIRIVVHAKKIKEESLI